MLLDPIYPPRSAPPLSLDTRPATAAPPEGLREAAAEAEARRLKLRRYIQGGQRMVACYHLIITGRMPAIPQVWTASFYFGSGGVDHAAERANNKQSTK